YTSGDLKIASDVHPEHLAKFVTFISCRPRDAVIKETLTHSSSMEENLSKLKESGEAIALTNNLHQILAEADIKFDQTDLNSKIQNGTQLVKIQKLSYEDIFNMHLERNPNAKVKQFRS